MEVFNNQLKASIQPRYLYAIQTLIAIRTQPGKAKVSSNMHLFLLRTMYCERKLFKRLFFFYFL